MDTDPSEKLQQLVSSVREPLKNIIKRKLTNMTLQQLF